MRSKSRLLGARWVVSMAAALWCLNLAGCGEDPISRVSGASSPHETLERLEEDTGAVESTIVAFNTAFDGKDAGGLRALFAENAQIFLYDGRAVDRDEFVEGLEAVWGRWSGVQTEYRLQGLKMTRDFGWAKLIETVSYQVDGRPLTMNNLITMAFQKRGDEWRIAHLHISTADLPPAAAMNPS